ncbi:hypothetical protein B4N89_00145 [Embleya scabrispora]|uniref:Uncharacterized protein n=1 Tax=Embleya scabrispora TaxID=159449 RepID=A0A1T3NRZ1_9ACTN|nr:hypothetical protein B4N89_00145 [Embleya scabrispora]
MNSFIGHTAKSTPSTPPPDPSTPPAPFAPPAPVRVALDEPDNTVSPIVLIGVSAVILAGSVWGALRLRRGRPR